MVKSGSDPLLEWIWTNRAQIRNGGVLYRGDLITPATEFTYYRSAASMIFVTTRQTHGPFIVGTPEERTARMEFTFSTALAGWWGIPWGPLFSIWFIVENLSGGERINVGRQIANRERRETLRAQ